jgi:tetratricopeptide (TPR) repeat protein
MIRRFILAVVVVSCWAFAGSAQAKSETCATGVDYLVQAQAQFDAATYADAQASYTCALETDPLNEQAHVGRLQAALLAGDYLTAHSEVFLLGDGTSAVLESAIAGQTDVLAAQPDSVTALQIRAFLLVFSGQSDAALTDVDSILAVQPDNVLARMVQAVAQEMMGDAEGAASTFAQAVALSPDNPQLYGLMAAAQWASFNIESMVANSSRAIELAPDLAYPYRLHGMSQMAMGNPEGVLADANQAIELDPTYYAFYILRANAHLMLGDPQAAFADLSTAIDLNPRTRIGHGVRAKVALALGDPEAAAQGFATFVELGTLETVEGAELNADEPVTVPMTAGRTYRLPFTAQAGQTTTIQVTSVNPGEVDPVVLVVGPDGTPLVFNDDASDETLDAVISEYELPTSGTYMLVVSHALGGSEGDIVIDLEIQ